ncbi:hypothetical protein BX070DRAFT_140733 [Coemansia spiralis]|nr:hypothetical protein BX070DRAFT_140733 [Coemansia spiralis]
MMSGNQQGMGQQGHHGGPPPYGQSGPGGGQGGPGAYGGRPPAGGGGPGGFIPPPGNGGGGNGGGYSQQHNMRGNANSSRGFQWVSAAGGFIPPNAVQGGIEVDGKPLFVARAMYKGGLHPGKAAEHIQDGGCSIGYGHKEVNLGEYQVLCGDASKLKWINQINELIIQGFTPVEGGYEETGEPLFIAKTMYDGSQQLGKCAPHIKKGMSFPYGHKEKTADKYLVLAYTN